MRYLVWLSGIMSVLFQTCSYAQQTMMDINIEIIVENAGGENLLNTITKNHYNREDIRIFYLINGVEEEVLHPDKDYPNNFFIYSQEGQFRMRLFPYYENTEMKTITLIHWKKDDIDEIKCEYRKSGNSVICTKVWINDKLLWSVNTSPQQRLVRIVK